MSNRNLIILALTAAAMLILAAMVSVISSKPYSSAKTGGHLIQGLDPDQIAGITIGKAGEQVILNRLGRNFVVANLTNYPALTNEINKLITTCLDIQTAQLYTDNPDNYKDLGVTEENATVAVKFYNSDSNLITGVIIGKQKERTEGIAYVRRVDDNKVYLTAAQIPWIKKRAIEYVEQELTRIKPDDIELVTVSPVGQNGGKYLLKPGPDGKTVMIENIPEGKKLKTDVAKRIFDALTNLTFNDVNPEQTKQGLKFDAQYICRLKDSTLYTIRLAKDGNDWFAKCDAEFMDKTPVVITEGQPQTEEEMKKNEAKVKARNNTKEFSEKHRGWIYQIPRYKAENMTKPIADLLEDITKPAEPNASADENLPQESEEEIDPTPAQEN
jgi:hypothetical protein